MIIDFQFLFMCFHFVVFVGVELSKFIKAQL